MVGQKLTKFNFSKGLGLLAWTVIADLTHFCHDYLLNFCRKTNTYMIYSILLYDKKTPAKCG